jgi:hypothetical protein
MEHLLSATRNFAMPSFWRSLRVPACAQGSISGKLDHFSADQFGIAEISQGELGPSQGVMFGLWLECPSLAFS